MKKLSCEMCGSPDVIKQEGLFVCQNCGTKYSVEDAKKMMIEGTVEVTGTVRVDNSSKYENYKKLAERAFKDKSYEEAGQYYEKILEINPDDWEAIYNKGLCSGWKTTLLDFRIDDTVKSSKNAFEIINNLEEGKVNKEEIINKIASDINTLVVSYSKAATAHYNKYWELQSSAPEYWGRLIQCIDVEEYALGLISKSINQKNKNVYIAILKNMIFYCCEICETRKYKSGQNQYGNVYTYQWYKSELRGPIIQKYNRYVEEIKKYDQSYIPKPIKEKKKNGCYVATAVYGSYDCPQVWVLRRFRDDVLDERWYGKAFIKLYYYISPTIVKYFGKKEWFNNFFKDKLDKMIRKLQEKGIEDLPYNDKKFI